MKTPKVIIKVIFILALLFSVIGNISGLINLHSNYSNVDDSHYITLCDAPDGVMLQ